jgi:hypothetical protein
MICKEYRVMSNVIVRGKVSGGHYVARRRGQWTDIIYVKPVSVFTWLGPSIALVAITLMYFRTGWHF